MSDFDNYFEYRDVRDDYYAVYTIPAYLNNVLPIDKNSQILDIGCGFGQTLDALRSNDYINIAGIDVSSEAISHCVARGLPVERIDDLSTFCMNCKCQYDFIIMSHVIEHLPKEQIVNILRMIRTTLLAADGLVFVTTPNAQSNTGCYWAYEDFTHTTIFTAGSLYYVFRNAGFERVEFVDPLGTAGSHFCVRLMKRFLIHLYKAKIAFWNRVTNSSFHRPSPQIYTYELKVLAK